MNKMYLVSKVIAYTYDTMNKDFTLFNSKEKAQLHFEKLVNECKQELMDYSECTEEELENNYDIKDDLNNLFCILSRTGEEEVEIELSEMEIN